MWPSSHTGVDTPLDARDIVVSRHRDNRHALMPAALFVGPYRPRRREAVHVGETAIHQDEIVLLVHSRIERHAA